MARPFDLSGRMAPAEAGAGIVALQAGETRAARCRSRAMAGGMAAGLRRPRHFPLLSVKGRA
ncbi:hypothetical protein [Sphingobium aquiterrae]|uniref:hypothetical protein n=1 Tax=Sphingobium aquiterrae TaxID=2038656 RepID=UPI003016BD69